MENLTLHFSTGLPQIDDLMRGSIGILEALFPNRIRAYYLVGSYADGSAIKTSDLDLVPLFIGAMQAGEERRFRQAVADLNKLSPIRLGFGLRNEDQAFREGGVGIKIGSVFVYGEDVRDQIPLIPLEIYRRSCIQTSIDLIRYQRGNPEQLSLPLDYPDAGDAYFGYVKEEVWRDKKRKSTASVFALLMFLASTIVTLKTGRYNASKSFSWKFYQTNIGDEWGRFLEEWYILGKQQWGYAVPRSITDRKQLADMCRQVLAFENAFMTLIKEHDS